MAKNQDIQKNNDSLKDKLSAVESQLINVQKELKQSTQEHKQKEQAYLAEIKQLKKNSHTKSHKTPSHSPDNTINPHDWNIANTQHLPPFNHLSPPENTKVTKEQHPKVKQEKQKISITPPNDLDVSDQETSDSTDTKPLYQKTSKHKSQPITNLTTMSTIGAFMGTASSVLSYLILSSSAATSVLALPITIFMGTISLILAVTSVISYKTNKDTKNQNESELVNKIESSDEIEKNHEYHWRNMTNTTEPNSTFVDNLKKTTTTPIISNTNH